MVQHSDVGASDDAKPEDLADWRGTQRYEVVRCIGRGGMGAVLFRLVLAIRGLKFHGIAAAASVDTAPPTLRGDRIVEVARLSQQLEREHMPWTDPLASILAGAAANARGDRAEALAALRAAVQRAETADMSLYGAAARHQLGRALGGDEGARQVEEAMGAMAAQGVRVPERFAAMLVPGRWTPAGANTPASPV